MDNFYYVHGKCEEIVYIIVPRIFRNNQLIKKKGIEELLKIIKSIMTRVSLSVKRHHLNASVKGGGGEFHIIM